MNPADRARHYAKLATRWAWIATTFAAISLTVTILILITS